MIYFVLTTIKKTISLLIDIGDNADLTMKYFLKMNDSVEIMQRNNVQQKSQRMARFSFKPTGKSDSFWQY